ncbi:MAG: hypothetical protein ISS35_01765 [Kiritimatiellae bacterium]|nr:hypothetical protein [Kiritimatiellia bacterium]
MSAKPDTTHFRWLPALIFATVVIAYVLSVPQNHSEAEDGYAYALTVETGDGALYHPHHVMFVPITRGLYRTYQFLGGTARAFDFMVWQSILSGACAAVLFFILLGNRSAFRQIDAIVVTAIMAGSYGFWRYSCEAEIYIPAVCAALFPLLIVTREKLTRSALTLASPLASFSALLHIMAVIPAVIVASVILWLRRRRADALLHAFFSGVVLFVAYLVCLPTSLLCPGVASAALSRPSLHLTSLLHGIVGMGQCIVSGNFLFGFETARSFLCGLFPDRMFAEECFMGQQGSFLLAVVASGLLLTLVFVSMVVIGGAARTALGGAHASTREHTPAGGSTPVSQLGVAAGLWLGLHATVVLIHEPANPELWVMAIPAFAVLAGLLLRLPAGRQLNAAPIFAMLLILHNYLGGMLWVADSQGDYTAQKAKWLIEHTESKDLIVSSESPVFIRYLRYNQPASVIALMETQTATLEYVATQLELSQGKVYATADVFLPPRYMALRYPHVYPSMLEQGRALRPQFNPLTQSPFGGVYLYSTDNRSPSSF